MATLDAHRSPVPLGVDFAAARSRGALHADSDIGVIRQHGRFRIKDATVQRYDPTRPSLNAVLISLPEQHTKRSLRLPEDSSRCLNAHYANPSFRRAQGDVVDDRGSSAGAPALLATLYSLLACSSISGSASSLSMHSRSRGRLPRHADHRGAFALLDKEISLTVIAAILTLVATR